MKLLSRHEAKGAQGAELQRQALRLVEVAEALRKQHEELNRTEDEFQKRLARQKEIWTEEEEAHRTALRLLAEETERLEERRRKALIPVELDRKRADALVMEATEHLERAKEAQEKAEANVERLEDLLDEMGAKLADVEAREQAVALAEQGAREQAAMTAAGAQALAERERDAEARRLGAEADLAERVRVADMRERSLEAREQAVADLAERLRREEIRLRDVAATLERNAKR